MLNENGVIIQKLESSRQNYRGVDGDNWYLNDVKLLNDYVEKSIRLSWCNLGFVECATDEAFVMSYIKESKARGIKYRILICETCYEQPKANFKQKYNSRFIGYDYAYTGGSYYSCVYNDVVLRNFREFCELKLNENNLFETLNDIEVFVKLREQLIERYDDFTFEKGDFIIYRLSELYYETDTVI